MSFTDTVISLYVRNILQMLDLLISATPTGEVRNELTEINIRFMLIASKLTKE